jgi:hypothetical protein
MLNFLEWINFDELPALVVLIGLLWVISGQMTRPNEATNRWVRRTAAVSLIGYAVMAMCAWPPSSVSELLVIVIRAVLATGFVTGLASILLPLAHGLGTEIQAAMKRHHDHYRMEAEQRLAEERVRREAIERQPLDTEDPARRDSQSELLRQQAATEAAEAQRERQAQIDKARAYVIAYYREHESLLAKELPRVLFETQLHTRFPENITPEQAWKAAEEMITALQPLVQQARERQREEEKEQSKREQRTRNLQRQIRKLEDHVTRLSASGLGDPEVTADEVRAIQEEIRRLETEAGTMAVNGEDKTP